MCDVFNVGNVAERKICVCVQADKLKLSQYFDLAIEPSKTAQMERWKCDSANRNRNLKMSSASWCMLSYHFSVSQSQSQLNCTVILSLAYGLRLRSFCPARF